MREVKFRGRLLDSGQWIYGTFYSDFSTTPLATHYIVDEYGAKYEVDRRTVGEYTGLKHANGVEIYEGDILRWLLGDSKGTMERGAVIFKAPTFLVDAVQRKTYPGLITGGHHMIVPYSEVIGNIHENPELLRKEV